MAGIDYELLRTLREAKGWDMKPFADKAKISLSYLCDIEAGRTTLKRSPRLIKRFAEILNVPISTLERRS